MGSRGWNRMLLWGKWIDCTRIRSCDCDRQLYTASTSLGFAPLPGPTATPQSPLSPPLLFNSFYVLPLIFTLFQRPSPYRTVNLGRNCKSYPRRPFLSHIYVKDQITLPIRKKVLRFRLVSIKKIKTL